MLEETGTVVALDGRFAWIQTIRQNTCSSCSAKASCGQSVLAKMSQGKANQVKVENSLHLSVGQEVVLGLSESAFLRASLLIYLVPLLALIAGAILSSRLFEGNEGLTALGGVVAMLVGFVFASKWCSARQQLSEFNPVMLRVAHEEIVRICDIKKTDVAGHHS